MAFEPQFPLPSKRSWAALTLSTAADGLSEEMDIGGATIAAIAMSTAWTAADLTFKVRPLRTIDYLDVYGSTGGEVTYTVAASRVVTFDPAFWLGFQFIQFRSGVTAAPVAQAEERTLHVALQALGVIR